MQKIKYINTGIGRCACIEEQDEVYYKSSDVLGLLGYTRRTNGGMWIGTSKYKGYCTSEQLKSYLTKKTRGGNHRKMSEAQRETIKNRKSVMVSYIFGDNKNSNKQECENRNNLTITKTPRSKKCNCWWCRLLKSLMHKG